VGGGWIIPCAIINHILYKDGKPVPQKDMPNKGGVIIEWDY